MRRIQSSDPQLIERVRQVLGQEYEPSARDPSWVPGPPGDGRPETAPPAAQAQEAERQEAEPPGVEPLSERARLEFGQVGPEGAGLSGGGVRRAAPRVLMLPSFLRHTRRSVSQRALAGLLCVVFAAAALFAVRFQLASRAGEPTAIGSSGPSWGLVSRSLPPGFTAADVAGAPGGASAAGSGGAAAPQPAGGGGSASAGGGGPPSLVVHVVGEVARPGVVLLTPGSRVTDAVAGAGGALASADLERVNLARVVVDGEQIHVPAPGEQLLPGANGAAGGAAGAGPSAGVSHTTAPRLIDLNTADVAALDTLPGVGPVLAQRIVEWRSQRGRFTAVEELNEVGGIGDKLFAQLKPRVTV